MYSVTGHIRRITFHNRENGFSIVQLESEHKEKQQVEEITAVGTMIGVAEGQTVELCGIWGDHPKYGKQLKVESYRTIYPTTKEGIKRFLASESMKGVGPVSADRIVAHFGTDTLKVLDSDPRRLLEVPGLGRKRAGLLVRSWKEQQQSRDTMVFLQSHGVGSAAAVKIWNKYEQGAIEKVRENPYQLERDIAGIGFLTADSIAEELGVARDAPQRIQAGICYLLETAANDGHTYVPEDEMKTRGAELLGVNVKLFEPALKFLVDHRQVVIEESRCYLPYLHSAEVNVAAGLERLLSSKVKTVLTGDSGGDDLDLSTSQIQAVQYALREKVMVLTGGPGTGKTTVTRVILRCFHAATLRVVLCSPTGRAAKRLAEATGVKAKTIHRLLEFMPSEGRFRKNQDDLLETDAIIVDEASMIDVSLMNALLRALPSSVRLILVGDVDQLPSVGPGNVMRDIIASRKVPTLRLNEIHRQKQHSHIVINAHSINSGRCPNLENNRDGDFFFVEEREPFEVANLIADLVVRRIPRHRDCDSIADIQVLTPMYRGDTGASNLNNILQQELNPHGKVCRQGDRELRVGDKVLQVRNNYDRSVFNGDLGRIVSFDAEENLIRIQFEAGVSCDYDQNALDEIVLAYAISVHRSQGSEFPVVVLPLTTQHYPMLQRNLLYTAVTRARALLIVVGSKRALNRAIGNNEVSRRHTALTDRLCSSSMETVLD